MNNIDWSRATITVRAPVIGTAMESVQEFDVPIDLLRHGQFDKGRELVIVTEEQYERIVKMLQTE